MNRIQFRIGVVILIAFVAFLWPAPAAVSQQLPDGVYARMQTTRGEILLRLEHDRAPLTVASFVGLAEGTISHNRGAGVRFYDGLTFHRVIDNFMIQGGDPAGNGTGGPGYTFADEFHPQLRHSRAGVLSMANRGPNTNGSQFFITHNATPWLDGGHTVFGHVVSGQDVVNAIRQGDRIERMTIERVGASAQAFLVTQESFDRLRAEATGRR